MIPSFMQVANVNVRIDEVVGFYDVWPMGEFVPFPRFVIKLVHRASGDYQGVPNVCVRNVITGDHEYTCGLGKNQDQALFNAIENFFIEVQKQAQTRVLLEKDFVFNHEGY